jgi:hypothetical protein
LGAASLKIAFGFKSFKFFLHSGTPMNFFIFFLRRHLGTFKTINIQVPIHRGNNFKLSLFFARAYNSFLPGLFCTTFHALPKLPRWRHDADTKLTATEPSKRQFGAAHWPPGMRVLWARKMERYHDLMSFRRRRFVFLSFSCSAHLCL